MTLSPNEETRLLAAVETIATALKDISLTMALRYGKDFPELKAKRPAEITRPDDEKKEQYSDRATPEFFEETERATGPSRFQRRLDESAKSGDQAQGSGAGKVGGQQ